MTISLATDDVVATITWDDGENRVNLDALARLNELLDSLEATSGPLGVVLTGVGKFFCNGLDLDRFAEKPDEFAATIAELNRTIGRLYVFPAYTAVALNGHAFAAGALLSCSFDYRVMRDDRGYWCMNEAAIGLPLTEELWRIISHRLPRATAVSAAMTARRFNAADAKSGGIVEEVAPESDVLVRAQDAVREYATLDRHILHHHKRLIHGDVAEFLGFREKS